MTYNPILDTDSYKLVHYLGYPEDVRHVYSYAESRGGRYPATIFFGLQPYLRQLTENRVTFGHLEEANAFASKHGLPFNLDGWGHILRKHGGYLPLKIMAAPEGSLIPTRNVLCTVENTDPAVPWLTSYVETALLRQLWYATTVVTRIFNMKVGITREFRRTSDSTDTSFALLDFSSRGCAGYNANEIGGAAYLANFLGSDSMPAIKYANEHYRSDMAGFSVPATEHSIMCSWGQALETDSFKTIIERMGGPGKTVSIVADTWNVFEAAKQLAGMADWIKSTGTTLVFRPDSGTPQDVLKPILKTLAEGFGIRMNTKSYAVLNGVKVLWGDGIDEHSYLQPFEIAADYRIAADSIMVGSGGGLMQADMNRDTCKFAFKASAVYRDRDGWEGIAKDPITDPGKQSKKGRFKLHYDCDTGFSTIPLCDGRSDVMKVVYENGQGYNWTTLDEVRARVNVAVNDALAA